MGRIKSLCFLAVVLAALGPSLCSGEDLQGSQDTSVKSRIDCHPQPGASQEGCEARGCIWSSTEVPNAPWCFFPEDSPYGYSLAGNAEKTTKGLSVYVLGAVVIGIKKCFSRRVTLNKLQKLSLFGNDISPVVIDVEFQKSDRLRFKIYDPNSERFEVPLHIESPSVAAADTKYDVEFDDVTSHFTIKRKSTGTVLWDASLDDLIFSNQYLQITTTVPSTSVYGFGEHEHPSFKHSMDFATYGMFSRDQSPAPFANLYGVHPFYLCVETDSNAHGVLLLKNKVRRYVDIWTTYIYKDARSVNVNVSLSPNPSLTFRTIGGILDFYMFLGPTPENVIQQYTEVSGAVCIAYGVAPANELLLAAGSVIREFKQSFVLRASLKAARGHVARQDVQHADIDYMERRLDFTYDKENYAGLPEYIKQLKEEGMHYVVILDPFISKDEEPGTYRPYDLGEEMGVWVNNSDGVTPAVGKAWPDGYSVFPDYTNPRTVEWWTQLCLELKDVLDYDGIWIDMNEPSNFERGQYPGCADNEINNPPYIPSISDRALAEKTLCPDSKTYLGDQYNTHSLFGWSQTAPTFHVTQKATGKRAFVLSRSTFVGSGKHGGHWLGDNFSEWEDLHQSIIGILEFNLFGIPFIGADICGFNYNTTYELCLRWMQLGSFYPFSRNHNAEKNSEQDPAVFGAEFAEISRDTLRIRYSLLPYLYTLFYESHVHGNTVARSLMHEFTSDQQTHDIDTAFLWGSAFMIAPVLQEGDRVPASWLKNYATVDAPLSKIPLFLRGGYILPRQAPATTTTRSRLNPFGLTIALDDHGEASGSLFWDDGDSIDTIENGIYFLAKYTFKKGKLRTEIVHNGYRGADSLSYNTVTILGLKRRPHAVALNGRAIHGATFSYQTNG
ncbi:PREDICTED: maltase-glucoamylase, intestinal-like, partial [Tinamus guttatus]